MSINTRRAVVALCLVAALAAIATPAIAQFTKFSEVPAGTPANSPAPPAPPAAPDGGLLFFTDRPSFTPPANVTITENYSGTLVPPGAVLSCPGPFDDTTDNACFPAGGIVDGIQVDNLQASENVVLGVNFAGNPNVAVGPNTFSDDMIIRFDDANVAVAAFGGDLECPFGPFTVNIEIYGQSGLLGSTTATCSPGGAFWGVISDELIDRIEFFEPTGGGELLSDVVLGNPLAPVPTTGTWGMIALVLGLVAISLLVLYRRRTV